MTKIKKILVSIFLIILVSLTITCQNYWTKKESKGPKASTLKKDPIIEVSVIKLKLEDIFEKLEFPGALEPITKKIIYAPFAGETKNVFINDGKNVKKGSRLVSIAHENKGYTYKDHIIKSPKNGKIYNIKIKEGQRFNESDEILSIGDFSSFLIRILSTSEERNVFKKNHKLSITINKGQNNELSFSGSVINIAFTLDKDTNSFPIQIKIPCNRNTKICENMFPGQIGIVSIKKNFHKGVKVPNFALHSNDSQVIVLNKDSTVSWRKVTVSKGYGKFVEITKGLKPGDSIVTAYSKYPKDGDKVKVNITK